MSNDYRLRAMVLSAVTLLGGCGAGSSGASDGARSTIPVDVRQAFNECMRRAGFPQVEEGLEDDDPLFDDQAFIDANQRCQVESGLSELFPGHEAPGDVSQEDIDEQLLALARCLRNEGWQVADPVPAPHGDGLMPQIPSFSDDEQQAAFNEDMGSCLSRVGMPVETGDEGGAHETQPPDDTSLRRQGGGGEDGRPRTSTGGDAPSEA